MATVGGITESKGSENSLEIDSLARFAVDEHNKKENALVQFGKVVNSKEQVVAGTMYYITLEATDGDTKKVYEAKVWVKPWMNFKELQDFTLIGDVPADQSA
ncbi:Cystatin domain [Dillenia turbinata]|uniref:Cysteine proteinase inhibitor n=1 Tax=Dillenia turbinata TaxID=194707 RepID=A0AAN8ZJX9_9MAGN